MSNNWEERAQQKREATLAAMPQEWRIENPPNDKQVDVTGSFVQQFLNQREIEITETTADRIVEKTTSGHWKAEAVIRAFCHRAALAHQLTNCLHEIFFDAAIADAKALDDYYAQHKKPRGALHGLPVSLKDQFHVKDVETTMGYVGWIGTFEGRTGTGKERVFESEMVRELRNCGAILYCKTAVPHTLMAGETVNNIIDYTWNPKNRNLSAGGSSGGEGALIGLKGSPVGFGTDIGGSIRIPAAFNGLYGLRPSTGRLPYGGIANSMDGQNSILSVVGPLATSASSLRLVTKAVLSQQPWLYDPLVHEIPWRPSHEQEVLSLIHSLSNPNTTSANSADKLSIAILHTDGTVTPVPPIQRALKTLASALQSQGHEVLPWQPPSHRPLLATTLRTWSYDAGADVRHAFALSGEPTAQQISFFDTLVTPSSATEIAATNVRLRELRKEHLEYWNSTAQMTDTGRPVDAVLAPVAPFPAARPGRFGYAGYSIWVNALDYTAAVVPVTTVDKDVDGVREEYEPLGEEDKKVWESYDPELYHGAHVGLQIVGRRLQEEKVLALAEYVERLLGSEV